MYEKYESAFSGRYASEYMTELFSQYTRIRTWRRLWTSLAKAQHELGLPVSKEQVEELAAHIDDIDFECAKEREKEVRHDVMAHVYAYGKAAPGAAGIIHLGATSCYVTDNGDLIIYREALRYIRAELCSVLKDLSDFALKYKSVPCLGY
ncbi:MAG: adenylosuccinate lyase, partial [Firmicutes bacterium]|nr:adenylosuccinate lyase [Bacillota bacterium]